MSELIHLFIFYKSTFNQSTFHKPIYVLESSPVDILQAWPISYTGVA